MSNAAVIDTGARRFVRFVKTTLVGGLVFLVPLAVLGFLVVKAVGLLERLARPLAAFLPVDKVWGVLVADIIAILAVILVCFLGGLFARRRSSGSLLKKAEANILWSVPGYGLIKALTDSLDKRATEASMRPVLIHFDDAAQIGFEVDSLPDGRKIVYVPGSPEPRAGSLIVMTADRVEPLPLTVMATLRGMRTLGKGLGSTLGARPEPAKTEAG